MAAYVTHYLFGLETLTQVHDPADLRLIYGSFDAFIWGLQGPDLLFFSRKSLFRKADSLPSCAEKMHSGNAAEVLETMADILREQADSPRYELLCAYMAGFICHYYLDLEIHPYVYYCQQRVTARSGQRFGIHQRIESDIDTVLYRDLCGDDIRHFRADSGLLHGRASQENIAWLYAETIRRLYPEVSVRPEDILPCFADMIRVMHLTVDPNLSAMAGALDILMRKPGLTEGHVRHSRVDYDVLNERGRVWYRLDHPGVPRRESVRELYEKALPESALGIRHLLHNLDTGRPLYPAVMEPFSCGQIRLDSAN